MTVSGKTLLGLTSPHTRTAVVRRGGRAGVFDLGARQFARYVLAVLAALTIGLTPATVSAQLSFTDAPLTTDMSPKAVHLAELRTAIADLRALRGLLPFVFTDPVLTSGVTRIRAVHLTDLRSALNDVFDNAGIARPVYVDAAVAGVQIKRAHIEEVRAAVIDLKWRLQPQVQVTLAGTGVGTVSSVAGLTCNFTCSERFATGTALTLAVTPVTGSQFTGWTGACTGTGSCSLTLNSDKAVTATFTRVTSTPPPLIITGIDRATAKPFNLVTLTGTGFDPANSAISVFVSPSASLLPVTVPVVLATSTTLTFSAPPLLDMYLGGFASGAVKLQVIAAVGSSLSTSDFFNGLSIEAPRASPISAGRVMRSFLRGAVNVADTTRPALGTGDDGVSLAQLQSELTSLIVAVSSIIANPQATVTLPTENGTVVLDKKTVEVFDTLALAYFDAFEALNLVASPGLNAPQQSIGDSPPCPLPEGQAEVDRQSCLAQRAAQQAAQQNADTVRKGGMLLAGFIFTAVGVFAAVAAVVAEVVTAAALVAALGAAAEVAATGVVLYAGYRYLAAGKPAFQAPPPEVVKRAVDTLKASGTAILTSLRSAMNVISSAATSQSGPSPKVPQYGLIWLQKALAASPGNRVKIAVCGVRGTPALASSSSCSTVDVFELDAPLSRATVALDGSTPIACNQCIVRYDRATALCEPLYAGSIFAYSQCINVALAAWLQCLSSCSGAPVFTESFSPAMRPELWLPAPAG